MGKEPLEGDPKMASPFTPLESGKDEAGEERPPERAGGLAGWPGLKRRCPGPVLGGKELRRKGGSLWQEDTPVRRAAGGRGPGEAPVLPGR